jgi:hypothetical protein
MERMVNINIKKRHVYILSALIILVGSILFVQGQGTSNFGHNAYDVDVVIGGTVKPLQNAINDGDLTSTITIGGSVNCMGVRSEVATKDYVQYCPGSHPTVVHCSIVDDEAKNIPPIDPPTWLPPGPCQSNGKCDSTSIRHNLDGNEAYLEIVKANTPKPQGCWQYNVGHSRNPYRIELICCE